MRVLLTVPSLDPRFGGPIEKGRRLAAELRRAGHSTILAGCGESEDAISLPPLGRFHGTPIPRSTRRLVRAVRGAYVVHILGFRDPVGTLASRAARRAGIPYLLEPVGMHRRRLRSVRLKAAFDRLVGQRMVERAALIVATSRLEEQELVEDGVPPERIRVRSNGVSVEQMLPLPRRGVLRERLVIPAEAPLVLALGRIAAKKGLPDLCRAVAGLDGVHLLIAGPDDRDGTLESIVRARDVLRLGDRLVIRPEGLWGADKAQALADADCFCLPSATENFGIAAAEAAAVGLPVVVSDQCGVAEWLDAKGHRVIPYGDEAALSSALREVLSSAAVRKAAARAATKLRKELAWSTVAARQVEIYEEALEAHRHGRSAGRGGRNRC